MVDTSRDVATGAGHARLIALTLVLVLAGTALLAAFVGERNPVSFWLLVLLLVAPLVATLPGLLRSNRRTFAWATLCVTPHFIYALTEAVANPAIRLLAAAMLGLSLGLVVTLVAYLRLTRTGGR
ncbi:MAG: DUF2069 domain-containing protein [Gammaproteobacteria bacterium]|nr:DUF2069 domain-containing protein [Gammaproteobacteria bacterium]MDH4312809.1 DUF2069 domain-containing protein [Gammaproteobacteria bacterium]MDH5271862.1 DUF2069 domain-containing protein [Gammaproteobacteria bacterium]